MRQKYYAAGSHPRHAYFRQSDCDTVSFPSQTMADYRKGYISFNGHRHAVTWHPISKDVYVYWGTDKYAGKAYNMQQALDVALSWLNSHAK